MIRYSKILNKNKREIVLLKSRPCKWGICSFCDYIDDNCSNDEDMLTFNKDILSNVTGEFKKLEVINSASVFELPDESLKDIKDIVESKGIKQLYFESHYSYKDRLGEIKEYFKGIDVVFKCGIETFDNHFRNKILKKGAYFKDYKEVAKYFSSICMLVGIEGQTKEIISNDMEIIKNNFSHTCINIYIDNTTDIKRDEDLVSWFKSEYSYLEDYDNIEILWNNTDFGVGDDIDECE